MRLISDGSLIAVAALCLAVLDFIRLNDIQLAFLRFESTAGTN